MVIIGGGITGLSAGIHLKKQGRSVLILEQGRIAGGTTGLSSAHLTTQFDGDFSTIEKNFSVEAAAVLARGMRGAISQIEEWCTAYKIDCGFRYLTGYQYAEPGQDVDYVRKELDAALRAQVEVLENDAVPPLPFKVEQAWSIARQAVFDPAAYLDGLARAFQGGTCEIREGVRVMDYADGEPCTVVTPEGSIFCNDIILATHTPLGRSVLHTVLEPWRSHIVVARLDEPVPEGLFWDAASPYNYLRPVQYRGETALLVGGADHKTGQNPAENPYEVLEHYTRARFKVRSFPLRWSAQFYAPIDGGPYIGKMPVETHIYAATGFDGDGLTVGSLSGAVLADLIAGASHPIADHFSTVRLKGRSLPKLAKFQWEAAKHFVQDRLSVESRDQITSLLPGDGIVVREHKQPWACCKLEDGTLLTHSAICPHMGCVIHWNKIEQTWDCPCHGGRFSPDGTRLEGPPRQDLGSEESAAENYRE